MFHRSALLAAVAAVALALPACGGGDRAAGGAGAELKVVATTTQLADMAREIAAGEAEVTSLLGPNADPHDHELRPSDLDALAGADLILRSGGEVDEWLTEAVEGAGAEAPVVVAGDAHLIEAPKGDPHWWQSPANAQQAVREIAQAMMELSTETDAWFERHASEYLDRLEALDVAVARCLRRVPRDRRKLVTTHDALGAYAQRYGIEVVGAVIPSRSTRGQASAGETAELVATIRRERVRTIFAESSVPARVEAAIAREAGARVGDALYADTLGPKGSSGDTYIKSIAANTRALVDGFTDGAVTCSLPSR